MIHIVTAENASRYADALEQAWRLRHRVFVEEKGWSDLARSDKREIDDFDDAHALHMLAIEGGTVVGYQRMLPTTRPYLLTEVLSELCEVEPPRSPMSGSGPATPSSAVTGIAAASSAPSAARCSPASSSGDSNPASTPSSSR